MARELNGLILFTGATGTGKTTSLAALLDRINQERSVHVVTLEDPIEYVHPQNKATFNQRETGQRLQHLRHRPAGRPAPGARRSSWSARCVTARPWRSRLTAAETGHLVLSTLHTIDAGQTINRILGMFEQEEQPQIRNRLVDTIRWIVSQRLLPKVGGGRVAAMEILCTSLRVKDLILNGETEEKTFYNIIKEGSALDMRTFDQHILELYSRGLITEKTAITYCSHKNEMNRGLDRLKAERGEATTSLTGLAMEEEPGSLNKFLGTLRRRCGNCYMTPAVAQDRYRRRGQDESELSALRKTTEDSVRKSRAVSRPWQPGSRSGSSACNVRSRSVSTPRRWSGPQRQAEPPGPFPPVGTHRRPAAGSAGYLLAERRGL